jgi:hypothetical protein
MTAYCSQYRNLVLFMLCTRDESEWSWHDKTMTNRRGLKWSSEICALFPEAVRNGSQINNWSMYGILDVQPNVGMLYISENIRRDKRMSVGFRKSARSSARKFRGPMDIFAVSMRFWEKNVFSHEGSGFLCIFVGISISLILSTLSVNWWDSHYRHSVAY